MALSTKCLRYLTLVADVLFMVLGLAAAVLQLVLVLPLISLLPLPRWLLPPLLLPLLPTLLAIPAGFVAFNVTRGERRWRLGGVVALQALAALAMAVLAGWSVSLWFSHRIETDLTALMNESLVDAKWHTVYHELQCCGPVGPTSFQGSSGIPSACCSREAGAAGEGPCSRLYSQGCVAPASDRIRGVLRDGAASQGGTALLMFICALSTAFFADALRRSHKKQREQQLAQEDKPLRTPILNQNQRY